MNIFNKILDIILHFIRRVLKICFGFIFSIICIVIYVVTFEPNTRHRATKRKAKRIRILTKVKLYLYKWFKPLFKFLRYDYFDKLYNNFHFLIENK